MQVWIDNRHPQLALREDALRRGVEFILGALGSPDAEVSVVLMGDEQIADLNLKYLDRRGPTNVIAFSMLEGEGPPLSSHLLGDVVVSLDAVSKESEASGMPREERLALLLIHGILHLLGYDHVESQEQARRMDQEEKRILKMLKDKMPALGFD